MKLYRFLTLGFMLLSFVTLIASNRTVAEWEPMRGVLIRHPFGIPINLIQELAAEDSVYILVQNASAQSQATNTLSAGSVNLSHVHFITAPTNSHWTRDWGPHSVFVNDATFAILDPIFDGYPWVPGLRYNLPYEYDDAVNSLLATYFDVPLLSFPAYLTGGNFMSDGYITAFSTAQMISENFSIMNSDQFLALANNHLGISNYQFTINPEFHGIQHIDCWAKLLDAETVLVKELPTWHPEYQRAENIAQQFATTNTHYGRPYRVVRIFCDTYSGNNAAAYTNSLILNRKVYVPLFGIAADAAALQTYMDAMPGYEVLGFTGAWYYYDALHCRTMGIADGEMLKIDHYSPAAVTSIIDGEHTIDCSIKSYGNHALLSAELLLHYNHTGNAEW
ncbi:MAG: agmatine deiminase family protein, partial [Candidatus Cloacimonadaceae bacterium]|nr:agmatine deiminase family protein [Candidatus Cloacimonadaceae bacterium]